MGVLEPDSSSLLVQEYGSASNHIHGQDGIGIVVVRAKVSREEWFRTGRLALAIRVKRDPCRCVWHEYRRLGMRASG